MTRQLALGQATHEYAVPLPLVSCLQEADGGKRDTRPLGAGELRGPLEPHPGNACHDCESHRRKQVQPGQGDHAVVHLGWTSEEGKWPEA